jgi:acyl dehydratase
MTASSLPSFAEATVGSSFTVQYPLTPELVREYCDGIDDANPWYVDTSPFGKPVAPPTLLFVMHTKFVSERYSLAGRVDTRHEAEFPHPAFIGSTVTVTMKVLDKFTRDGREFIVAEYRSVDEHGRLLCRDRNRILLNYQRKE